MIENPSIRLMIGMGVPILTALVMEQLPKTGIADVPFAFQVKDQTLPPGTYSVRQADLGRTFRIQNEKIPDAQIRCIATKRKFGRPQEARLVFEKSGGSYLLSEIWFGAEGQGVILVSPDSGESDMRSVGLR